jgi:hypothetical protein
MEVDYVRVYQNTTIDTIAPTNFTASIGTVTSNSIELLLNATDNSGNIAYSINYSGGTINTTGLSNTQKSVVIPNLLPNTNYSFTISASDLSGNNFASNPLVRNATTLNYIGCSGTDIQAQVNSFTSGYDYEFETIGTNVKITFELLDTDKTGVFAYLWRQSPFAETQMTNVSGKIFTHTITNQTIGSTINYAVKFAYTGGLSVTRYFSYVVGNNCALEVNTFENNDWFTFKNPVEDNLLIKSNTAIQKIEIYDLVGNLIIKTNDVNQEINVQNLSKGIYLLTVYSENKKTVKKIIIK